MMLPIISGIATKKKIIHPSSNAIKTRKGIDKVI